MCKPHIPQYRCGHFGDSYDVCDGTETFHGVCEGQQAKPRLVKHEHCCSEECCRAAIDKKQDMLRQLEQDVELLRKEGSNEILRGARGAVEEERKRHENLCGSRPRESEGHFDAWSHRRETEYDVNKMWSKQWWFE